MSEEEKNLSIEGEKEEEEVEKEEEEEEPEEEVEEVEEDEEMEESEAEESDAEESDVASEGEEGDEGDEEAGVEGAETLVKKTNRKGTNNNGQKKVVVTGIEMLEATKNPQNINSAFEEESDEEPEDTEQYLQKFDSEMRDDFILNYHPEARTHNYEEVKALARVTRDGRGIIVDPMHKTLPFLTKYEMTRVLGQRAKQLDSGAKPFVKVPLNVMDGYHIAKLELEQKKMPFIIKRPFPNGGIEYWHVSDLEVL
jgi:DNA-directed RNA polymerase subunit K/omega